MYGFVRRLNFTLPKALFSFSFITHRLTSCYIIAAKPYRYATIACVI